jgi:hypothetical protein
MSEDLIISSRGAIAEDNKNEYVCLLALVFRFRHSIQAPGRACWEGRLFLSPSVRSEVFDRGDSPECPTGAAGSMGAYFEDCIFFPSLFAVDGRMSLCTVDSLPSAHGKNMGNDLAIFVEPTGGEKGNLV